MASISHTIYTIVVVAAAAAAAADAAVAGLFHGKLFIQ